MAAVRLGERVRRRRVELGRSQRDVAACTMISRNSLQTIETGSTSNPRLATLVRLASTLGVTVGWLVAADEV